MRYQKIFTQIWNDEKFSKLKPSSQLFFLYLLTNPHSNLVGCYVLKKGYVCEDLDISPIECKKQLKKCSDIKLISYDEDHKIVLIRKYLHHNPITNPNQLKAGLKLLKSLPNSFILQELKVILEGLPEGLSKGLLEGILYTVTASDTVPVTASDEKKIKHKYGEYKNVLLTDDEVKKLKETLNSKFEYWIEIFSKGIRMKSYGYTDHYLAILKWSSSNDSNEEDLSWMNREA